MLCEYINEDAYHNEEEEEIKEKEEKTSNKITENISNELFKSFDFEIDKLINLGKNIIILIL